MIELIIQLSDGTKAVHQLNDGIVTIGRDTDNVIIIADGSVSRHHAEVKAGGDTYTLRDLNSANGTTVNGEPITERIPKDGDVICFGTIQATWVSKPPPSPPPAPVVVPVAVSVPASVSEVDRPSPGNRHALVLGAVLLIALSAIVFLVHHRRQANGRTPEIAAVDKSKGQKTKAFWDKTHQLEDAGNQQSTRISFGEYPKTDQGMFDFRWFDDHAFENFLEKLDTRSKGANQIAGDISHLDKSDVDADLLAYTDELCTQWKSAADLDLYLARYVSLLYKQHEEPEHPPNQDDIQALEKQWTTKLNEHRALTKKVIARETSTSVLLTGRYKTEFKR